MELPLSLIIDTLWPAGLCSHYMGDYMIFWILMGCDVFLHSNGVFSGHCNSNGDVIDLELTLDEFKGNISGSATLSEVSSVVIGDVNGEREEDHILLVLNFEFTDTTAFSRFEGTLDNNELQGTLEIESVDALRTANCILQR